MYQAQSDILRAQCQVGKDSSTATEIRLVNFNRDFPQSGVIYHTTTGALNNSLISTLGVVGSPNARGCIYIPKNLTYDELCDTYLIDIFQNPLARLTVAYSNQQLAFYRRNAIRQALEQQIGKCYSLLTKYPFAEDVVRQVLNDIQDADYQALLDHLRIGSSLSLRKGKVALLVLKALKECIALFLMLSLPMISRDDAEVIEQFTYWDGYTPKLSNKVMDKKPKLIYNLIWLCEDSHHVLYPPKKSDDEDEIDENLDGLPEETLADVEERALISA